jgi:hypothetical protein
MLRKIVYSLTTAAAILITTGCAFQSIKPGASRAEVISTYGQPTNAVALPSGTRLQYSLQPLGRYAYMVDLDASDRVVSTRQVLNPTDFARVVPGQWTRQDAEREFGRPAMIDRVASWSGDVMTYRWADGDQPMFFYLYLDAASRVQRTGMGMEFPVRLRDD